MRTPPTPRPATPEKERTAWPWLNDLAPPLATAGEATNPEKNVNKEVQSRVYAICQYVRIQKCNSSSSYEENILVRSGMEYR